MTDQVSDVIVIGSGFGGAIPASHLIDAGFKVTLLERGPWRDTLPVRSMGIKNRAKFPQGRKFFTNILRSAHAPLLPRDGVRINARGMYEFFVNKGITNICTSSVGGGSHAYSGLNQRPIVENYWDGHAEDVSSDGMETYYQAVMAKLGSHHRLPEDKIPNTTTELFASSDVFSDVNGYDAPAFGLLFPKEPGHPKKVVTEDGIERMESAYDDDSFLGSAGGVKSSLDFIYLAGAIKKGLTVRDLCEVTRIERVGEGNEALYRVEVMDHQAICQKSFYARKVIVAAGAMNTLKLLFHSLYTGGLSGMPRLGRGIGSNGDYGGYWSLDQEGADFTRGMTIHGPIGVKGIEKTYLVLGGVVGLQHVPLLPKKLRRRIGRDAFLGGMGPDACDGIATYHQGRLSITYDASNSPIFDDIRRALEIAGKASGKRVRYLETPFTVHTCGGACLGSDIDHGVINANGEIFDNPGLFVTDAAALPAAPGGPPSMTIAAWASHVAQRMIEQRDAGSPTPIGGEAVTAA